MKRASAFLLITALVSACGAARAQTQPPAGPPAPPIAIPVPPQPDDYAPFVRASQPLEMCGCSLRIDFIVRDDEGLVRMTRDGPYPATIVALEDPMLALRLLADRRLSELWPAIVEWSGPGLERIVDAAVVRARQARETGTAGPAQTTSESSVRPAIRALLQYATALSAAGRHDEAVAVLRDALSQQPQRGGWAAAERTMVRLRLVSERRDGGDVDGALAELTKGEAEAKGRGYASNFMINRAALLAEMGRYADALAAIDAATAQFDKESTHPRGGGRVVPGSNRQFGWIRACALQGLGRTGEARALASQVRGGPEPSSLGFVLQSNQRVSFRADRCLKDHEALVSDALAQMEGPALASPAWLWLQPGYRDERGDAAILDAVRRDPRIVSTMAGRMRELPPELVKPLNRWRGTPRASTP